MKINYNGWLLLLFVCSAAIFTTACTEDKDPCDETKIDKFNVSVQPKLKISDLAGPDGYVLKDASELRFDGFIHKYHCGGSWSAKYDLNSTHDLRAIDDYHWNNGFYVGKVYGFDFDNSEDYLQCGFTLTATFEDGKSYWLGPINAVDAKPPLIPDFDRSYFFLTVTTSEDWMPVN